MVRRFLLEHGIAEPGIGGEQQVPLGLDKRPLAVDLLVQLGLGQPGAVERRLPQRLDGIPSSPVVVGGRGVTPRQHPRGVLPVQLGLDVGGHVDVVDDETLVVATEVDVAAIAVDDLQTADLAIADLEAGKVAQVMRAPRNWSVGRTQQPSKQSPAPVPPAPSLATKPGALHEIRPWVQRR